MINHVAIKLKDGRIFVMPRPYRHFHVYEMMEDVFNINCGGLDTDYDDIQGSDEGFIGSNMEYLDRKQAYILANENGQFFRQPHDSYRGIELFSENLW